MKSLLITTLIMGHSFAIAASNSATYLCGNDEDGCRKGRPNTCVCVVSDPHDQSHCFDHHKLRCVPPLATGRCRPEETDTKTQGRCLALVWQSEPEPSCQRLKRPANKTLCAVRCTSLENCNITS